MIGKTLGHYQITNQLGKGGMGEVFQAKDHILGRNVAIKVLPNEFAKDVDRVARFQREAKVLASLNNPNIAAIYGLEQTEGKSFLVLELVEGETLAERLKRGAIPVEESLRLALQIAEALEAAHEKGVIHRDLKPSNIKVTPDGKAKVLDFGLAKAFAGDKEEVNLSSSPTLSDAATQQGVILGTAAYMSPEQARGKSVDKRADIWAFGCVLFEMLTGRVAFRGEDVSEILASVIKEDVKMDLLPANLHPRVREVIIRCLQRDLKKRYSGITDARYEIEQALVDSGGVLVQPIIAAEPREKSRTTMWVSVAVILTAIVVGLAIWKLKPTEPRQVMRFEYELPEGQQFSSSSSVIDVSPDGKQFVYGTPKGLYLRSVDELTARLIAGTEGNVQQPFFSPDGKWVGYLSVADNKLKKIAISGGAPVVLCDATSPIGASWAADNTIVYGQYPGGIMRISANGGTPESLIKTKSKSELLGYPQILPDGKSVLYTAGSLSGNSIIMVQSLKSGEPKELFAGLDARYLPTGHIVYALINDKNSALNAFAVKFDLNRLEVNGGSVPVVEGLARFFAISDSGTLVYAPGTANPTAANAPALGRTLVWVDRKGHDEPILAPPKEYRHPKISPDGTRLALSIENKDIWIWDLVHKTLTRLTFEGGATMQPIWTPDGKRIMFWSMRKNGSGIYWKAADGTGQDELLSSDINGMFFPYCLSNDGKYLVGAETPDAQRFDMGMLSMAGDHARKTLLHADYMENQPQLSPNGRWVAYESDESHKLEIYVRSFPDVNKGRWQVSTNGGDSPIWSPDGHELFYMNGDAVMAVSVTTDPTFSIVGEPQVLFRGTYVGAAPANGTSWDFSPDGKRLLMIKPPPTTAGATTATAVPRPKINIVLNWTEELKQRVPVR